MNTQTQASETDEILQFEYAGEKQRLDKFLSSQAEGVSRVRLQELIRAGHVKLNGIVQKSPSCKIVLDDKIELVLPPPEDPEPEGEDIPLNIVFEDDAVIVIDKPAGLVVHPAPGNWTGTLVNALIHHCGDSLSGIAGVRRPGIVHRLDKDTSGIMVVAKTDAAHQALAAQFADHGRTNDLERAYLAVVWGKPPRPSGVIETGMARSRSNRQKMAAVSLDKGKEAITHYKMEQLFALDIDDAGAQIAMSLVKCQLETGRTHQIRVHMSHLGHPLLRDPLYGTHFLSRERILPARVIEALDVLSRQALHATLLQITHPVTGEVLRFESPLPEDMARLTECLERS